MDIVICVALKNCQFLRRNLSFIQNNLSPTNIFIITNRRNYRLLKFKERNVELIDEDKLVDGLTFSKVKDAMNKHLDTKAYGWYFQQFLKMGFALSKYATEEYLVWDSDTIPLRKIEFKKEGHYLFLSKLEHHQPYFDTMNKLLDLPIKVNFSFIAEHMIFNVKVMRELISEIGDSKFHLFTSNETWFEKCIYAGEKNITQVFSEFETYGIFCLNRYPELYKERTFRTFRRGSKIFGIYASRNEIESLIFDLDTVSFELYDYPISFFRYIRQWCFSWKCRIITKFRNELLMFICL